MFSVSIWRCWSSSFSLKSPSLSLPSLSQERSVNDVLPACLSVCRSLPPPRRICNCRCSFVCLFVCLLAALRKNFRTDLHEIFREGWPWANEQTPNFDGDPDDGSGSDPCPDPYRDTGKTCHGGDMHCSASSLWSPYVIGRPYIFSSCSFFLSSFHLLFFPRLISAVGDWMSTILLHMAWP